MKRSITFVISAALLLATFPSAFAARAPQAQGHHQAQSPTPRGFSTLLCVADALLAGGASLPGEIILVDGKVMVQSTSPVTTDGTFSFIDVLITHGQTSSEHTITFIDSNTIGVLECEDTIVAVS